MEKLFCLFVVTSNSCYTMVAGSRPTKDEETLEKIRELVIKIRPGHGVSWSAMVLEVDGSGSLTQDSERRVQFVRSGLS